MNRVEQAELPAFATSFLKELAFVLRGSDERENVLHDVREHLIEAMLAAPRGRRQAAVREALAELGTVEQIASTSSREVEKRPGRLLESVAIIVAVVSVPVALLVPVYGALFALLVFVSMVSIFTTRRLRLRTLGRFWTPLVISGCALLLGVVVLTLQLPFGHATPAEVNVPVSSY